MSNEQSIQRQISDAEQTSERIIALPDHLRMATSEKTIRRAAYAMIFCVLCDAIQLMCIFPNIPLMVTPGAHPESFSSTYPLDITSAQYVLIGAGNFGVIVSNFTFGYLADKFGSRSAIITLMVGSVVFPIVKYLARHSYWVFVALQFVNGLFGATKAVACGYMCIIFQRDRIKADTYIGYAMATMVGGRSLGGLLTIFFPKRLFLSLLPAAGICALGLLIAYKYVLAPDRILTPNRISSKSIQENPGDCDAPEKLDKIALSNVIFGSLMDNLGSIGIVPLGFTPVMYQVFYLDFVRNDSEPVMSENQYRILYSMIAVACLPVAILSPVVFKKIGPALSCVTANILTAAVVLSLLFTASINPARPWTFALYSSILYIGFPMTVISNLSTGPMLDRLAPYEIKGFIQGITATLYDLGSGSFPIVFGFITDAYGWSVTMWICFGASIVAAVVNIPLIFNMRMKRRLIKPDRRVTLLNFTMEEEKMLKSLKNLDRVPIKTLFEINHIRALKGQPPLQSIFGTYTSGDDEKFGDLTTEDLQCISDALGRRLALVSQDEEHKKTYVKLLKQTCPDEETYAVLKREVGDWFVDYLFDNGWFAGLMNAQICKAWIIKSFPSMIYSPSVREDNVEEYLINFLKFTNDQLEEREGLNWARTTLMERTATRRKSM